MRFDPAFVDTQDRANFVINFLNRFINSEIEFINSPKKQTY